MNEESARYKLPEGWTECQLSDYVTHKSGDSKIIKGKQSDEPRDGLFQAYSASGPDVWVDASQYDGEGVVVSAVGARCGKTFLASGKWTAIANTHVVIPGPEVQTKFFWYLSNREDWWIRSGTAQPFVKVKDTLLRPFQLPPREEQELIVNILDEQFSRLDAVLNSVRAVKAKIEKLRGSLTESCMEDKLGFDFGDEWETKLLGDLVEHKSDIVDGPFGSNLKSEHYVDSGIRVIRLQNIGYGEFRDEKAFITEEHFKNLKKHNVIEGDLLFASLGERLPRTCLVPDLGSAAIVKADCIRIRLSSKVNKKFVLFATQSPSARIWAMGQLHGLGRPRLGLGNIREFPIRIPSLDAQNEIASFLDVQFSHLDASLALTDGIEKLASALRRSLLHAAFTGELTKDWREGRRV
jgi:restriction endonuclease S subunit